MTQYTNEPQAWHTAAPWFVEQSLEGHRGMTRIQGADGAAVVPWIPSLSAGDAALIAGAPDAALLLQAIVLGVATVERWPNGEIGTVKVCVNGTYFEVLAPDCIPYFGDQPQLRAALREAIAATH